MKKQNIDKANKKEESVNITYSTVVDANFNNFTQHNALEISTPIVNKLAGVLKGNLDFNCEKEKYDYLEKKYK